MNRIVKFISALFGRDTPKPVSDTAQEARIAKLRALGPEELSRRQNEAETELIGLIAERQRLLVGRDYEIYSQIIKERYGDEVGQKVLDQNIEVGMNVAHLAASFGNPDIMLEGEGETVVFIYGNEKRGSLFRLLDNVIIEAVISVRPPLPIIELGDDALTNNN